MTGRPPFSSHLGLPIPVNPKLRKDHQVQKQRSSAASYPARIEKNILTVSSSPLSALASTPYTIVTFDPRTFRLVGQYAHDVREIAHAREKEKQHADTFGAFPAVVEKELGNTRAQVENGAEVAEYLAPEVQVERF